MFNYFNEMVNKYPFETDLIEFKKIDNFILKYFGAEKEIKLVDIGCGMCLFADHIKSHFKNIEINCADINSELVEAALKKGYNARSADALELPYKDGEFDIVHCSHVIEHFGYPGVIKVIEELFRVAKKEAVIILRSPLVANHRFYDDIDHVRVYPPAAILNYITNPQQQKVGQIKACELERWYTRIAFEINYYKYDNFLTRKLNKLFKILWMVIGFPYAAPNNYGLILKKI